MRLSEMSKEQLVDYLDAGELCHQDVIDLYDDLQKAKAKSKAKVSPLLQNKKIKL